MCSHTPVLAQRLNRRCVFFQSPKRSGKSRQGIPARYRYTTASTNRQLSRAVTPTSPAFLGSKSLMRSHYHRVVHIGSCVSLAHSRLCMIPINYCRGRLFLLAILKIGTRVTCRVAVIDDTP